MSNNPNSYDATSHAVELKAGDDCPKCHIGELTAIIHRYQEDGGHPDCAWLMCLDCDYRTDPE